MREKERDWERAPARPARRERAFFCVAVRSKWQLAKGYDDEDDDDDRQRRRAEDDEAGREGVGDEDDVVDECVCTAAAKL